MKDFRLNPDQNPTPDQPNPPQKSTLLMKNHQKIIEKAKFSIFQNVFLDGSYMSQVTYVVTTRSKSASEGVFDHPNSPGIASKSAKMHLQNQIFESSTF